MIQAHRAPSSPLFFFSLYRSSSELHPSLSHSPRLLRRTLQISATKMGGTVLSPGFIGDHETLAKKKAAIRHSGPGNLQVIADFDGTLTRYWIDGSRGQTSHGLLQQSDPEFDAKRQALYEYYHPLEYSPTIPVEEKTKLMEEWWNKTHSLLIEGGLTYGDIQKSVLNANIAFRDGVTELFEFLEEKGVPVLVFSAGLADIIEEVFRQKLHRSFKNIKIVSNRMVFENDRLVAFKGKTIHVLNKNEHALDMAGPLHDQLGESNGSEGADLSVKKRTNVLLLGDHTGDLGMSDGLNYDNRITIGFLTPLMAYSWRRKRTAISPSRPDNRLIHKWGNGLWYETFLNLVFQGLTVIVSLVSRVSTGRPSSSIVSAVELTLYRDMWGYGDA